MVVIMVQVTAHIHVQANVKNLNVSVSSRYPVTGRKSVIRIKYQGQQHSTGVTTTVLHFKKNIPSSRSVGIVARM